MSYTRLWVHLIWTTKSRNCYLNNDIRDKIIRHMCENARIKNIDIVAMNGYYDHIHALISIKPDQKITDIVRLIKGESSNWINKRRLTKTKFLWQHEYYAITVSPGAVKTTKEYIINQATHHRAINVEQEINRFKEKYNFKLPQD